MTVDSPIVEPPVPGGARIGVLHDEIPRFTPRDNLAGRESGVQRSENPDSRPAESLPRAYGVSGILVSSGQPTEFWVVDGRVTYEKVAQVRMIEGWILPGLVDAHCHVGLDAHGGVDRITAEAQAKLDLSTGVTLIRDAGSPVDTHWMDGRSDLPRIIRAGRHIARPRRYIRGFAVEVEPGDLVAEVRRQARVGDGWVKLVGDWIDRDLGDLAPLWPQEAAREAILAAHEEGARVTAHCFGEESVNELVHAGIDCIEHGCGLDDETISHMATRSVALVPTLDNLKIFPGIADQAQERFPRYAAHMRHLYERRVRVVRSAVEAGVEVYCGTDAGGTRAHGTVLQEIQALAGVLGPSYALSSASWRARPWLGSTNLEEGSSADFLVVARDPRQDLTVLDAPQMVVAHGTMVHS